MFVLRQDWDKDLSGGITVEQMREIFRIYKVLTSTTNLTNIDLRSGIVEAQVREQQLGRGRGGVKRPQILIECQNDQSEPRIFIT